MYLEIDLNGTKKEDLEKVLSSLNVKYEEFENPLKLFLKEEAEFRVDTYIENLDEETRKCLNESILNKNNLINELVDSVAKEFYDSEHIFYYDNMDEIVEKNINFYLTKTAKTEFFINKEKLKEIQLKLSIDDLDELDSNELENMKAKQDDSELIGRGYFTGKDVKLNLLLCSGQTNYWLETHLIKNSKYVYTSEPFFNLEDGDEVTGIDDELFVYSAKLISI